MWQNKIDYLECKQRAKSKYRSTTKKPKELINYLHNPVRWELICLKSNLEVETNMVGFHFNFTFCGYTLDTCPKSFQPHLANLNRHSNGEVQPVPAVRMATTIPNTRKTNRKCQAKKLLKISYAPRPLFSPSPDLPH